MRESLLETLKIELEALDRNTHSSRLTELAENSPDLARIVALNPSTAPELLRQLSSSCDRTTRKNVATNPSTPTDVLLNLGSEFTVELLNNPKFNLLGLQSRKLFNKIPHHTLVNLLKCESVPVVFLELAANRNNLEIQLAIAMNPQTPISILKTLIQSFDPCVQQAALMHINLTAKTIKGWEEVAKEEIKVSVQRHLSCSDIEAFIKVGLISTSINTLLPQKLQRQLINNVDTEPSSLNDFCLNNIIPHPKIYADILEQLATEKNIDCRRNAATNPKISPSLLKKLALDNDLIIRQNVAKNPNTPAKVLELFAEVNNYEMRHNLAANPNTPARILEELAEVDDDGIRYHLASNPNTPTNVLKQLAKLSDYGILYNLVSNPKTPSQILEQFLCDRNWKIAKLAATKYLAKNPQNLPIVLDYFAKATPFTFSRLLALFHPQTSLAVLEENSRSLSWLERYAITQNLRTPRYILKSLATDGNRIVRAAAKASLPKQSIFNCM